MEEVGAYIPRRKAGTGLYYELFQEAIAILQDLASDSWTDYNAHDPGITLLENAIYGLSDVAYRAGFKMEDLLLKDHNHVLQSGDNGLFIASDILTTNPITLFDLRKGILDKVPSVKNVWVENLNCGLDFLGDSTALSGFKGLYNIAIEMSEYSSNPEEQSTVRMQVRDTFHTQRNLCEYLYEIDIYRPYSVCFRLDITIEEDANGEEVLSAIYRDMLNFFEQEVEFNSLWELQKANVPTKEIFNGPKLKKGFINDSSMQQRQSVYSVLDLVKLINRVDGVVHANSFDLLVKPDEDSHDYEPLTSNLLLIPPLHFVNLKLPMANEDVVFQTAGLSYEHDKNQLEVELAYLNSASYGHAQSGNSFQNEITIPKGTFRNIEDYYQLRYQLPDIYGIGTNGLVSDMEPLRYAQAKQLKAYLMPLDQLMTNMLSQMARLNEIYDTANESSRTYFSQTLSDIDAEAELLNPPMKKGKNVQMTWKEMLRELDRKSNRNTYDRSIASIRDLLSRFGEVFPDYALRKISKTIHPKRDVHVIDKEILGATRRYVQEYASVSYNRAKAYNYRILSNLMNDEGGSVQDVESTPGILRKLALLLCIHDPSIRRITNELSKFEIRPSFAKTGMDSSNAEPNESNSDPKTRQTNTAEFHFIGTPPYVLDEVLRFGIHAHNYQSHQLENGTTSLTLLNASGEHSEIYRSVNEEDPTTLIEGCVAELKALDAQSEGIFLIEHVLLLPRMFEDNFGFSIDLRKLNLGLTISLQQCNRSNFQHRNELVKLLFEQMGKKTLRVDLLLNDPKDSACIIVYRMKNQLDATNKDEQVIERLACSSYYKATELYVLEQQRSLLESCFNSATNEQIKALASQVEMRSFYGPYHVDEAFFSLQMSLILPSWPTRFQNENFRTLLSNALEDNLPIHLQAHVLWFSFDVMTKFEDLYFKWLRSLSSRRIRVNGYQRMDAYNLIEFLTNIRRAHENGIEI